MDPLQLEVTWYKIRHAGEQVVHWDIQNKATSSRQICIFFVLDVPVRSLLSSMVDFVPCDCPFMNRVFVGAVIGIQKPTNVARNKLVSSVTSNQCDQEPTSMTRKHEDSCIIKCVFCCFKKSSNETARLGFCVWLGTLLVEPKPSGRPAFKVYKCKTMTRTSGTRT